MGRIKKLPSELVEKIAAGEVVERPASVVKELIENSLDAGATKIEVWVEEGGKRLIRVRDDGTGMSRDDLLLAVQEHTTSKIEKPDDLYAIRTFGFRGEALASIGAVSHLTITTRERGSEEGWRIEVKGGSAGEPVETNAPEGTDVIVRYLFFNTPARLRFLKRSSTEENYVRDVVKKEAISSWNVGFSFSAEGKRKLYLPPSRGIKERVRTIFAGEDFVDDLTEFSFERDGMRISGVYAPPAFARKRSSYIFTYVNGRFVKNQILDAVIIKSFRNFIPPDRYPVFVLFLEVPPEWIDVNVHPSKLEVKFFNEKKIMSFVGESIISFAPEGVATMPVEKVWVRESEREEYATSSPVREGNHSVIGEKFFESLSGTTDEGIKILGQAFGTYIIYQKGDSLYFMDQHATHEKILYLKLMEHFEGKSRATQYLLVPVELKLSDEKREILERQIPYLESLGFGFERKGQRIYLTAYPSLLTGEDVEKIVEEVIVELEEEGEPLSLQEYIKKIAATVACKSAIKGNTPLSFERMKYLIQEAEKYEESKYCPHGRPAIYRLSKAQFEKIFLRDEH